ncbi:unnamed protein product [Schistosoma haematobium]|nr:unnamed protein product [Schistosoma haematobium]
MSHCPLGTTANMSVTLCCHTRQLHSVSSTHMTVSNTTQYKPPLPLTHTNKHTQKHRNPQIQKPRNPETLSITPPLIPTTLLIQQQTSPKNTHTLTHSNTHSLIQSPTHSLTHSHTHTLTINNTTQHNTILHHLIHTSTYSIITTEHCKQLQTTAHNCTLVKHSSRTQTNSSTTCTCPTATVIVTASDNTQQHTNYYHVYLFHSLPFTEPGATPDTQSPSSTTPDDDDLYIYYIDKSGKRRRRPRPRKTPSDTPTSSTPVTGSVKQPGATPDTQSPSSTTPDDDDLYIYYIDKSGKRRRRPRPRKTPSDTPTSSTPVTGSVKPLTTDVDYYENYEDISTTIGVKKISKRTTNSIDQFKPIMRKTIIYKEKPSSNSSDDYYDEVVETTWVVKLGDKNITDKDLLNYLNNQTKDEDLFERKNGSKNSDESSIETETSWFTMGRKNNLTEKDIMKFFDDQLDLDDLLKTVLPTGKEKTPPREVISRKVWISDNLDKELKEWNFDQIVQDTFKDILKQST